MDVSRRETTFVHPRRLVAVALVIVATLVVLSVRLYDLQVVNGAKYRVMSEDNRVLRLPVGAERGVIVDRNGVALVRNLPGFAVTVLPVDVAKTGQEALAFRLGALLGRGGVDVEKQIADQRIRNPYEPVTVSERPIGRELALLLSERADRFPGVRVVAETVRFYESATLYAPIMGYTGPVTEAELETRREAGYLPQDDIGRTGLERVYEKYLRGQYGWREIERDAGQRELRELAVVAPVRGSDVVLTLDDRLQKILADELTRGVAAKKYSQAVGLAMDPRNGEILAMVTVPGYDNNMFIEGITQKQMDALNLDWRRPLVNKAIGEIYPPGSTYKLVTGLAALSEGVANRGTTVNVATNVLTVGGFSFFDWRAHGIVDFVNGFAYSSDIYFYTLAGGNPNTGRVGVGPEKLAEYARALGFGAPTGVDLPGEEVGILPDPAWKQAELGEAWTLGNTYQAAIGQGFVAVTPLQLLNAYAAVANGGTLQTPHFLKEVRDAAGNVTFVNRPKPQRELPIKDENLALIREGARKVVTSGMAFMPNPKVVVAGKTGTAEFGMSAGVDRSGRNELEFHNWFVSWVPKTDPQGTDAEIAMLVFTFNSSQSACASCVSPAVTATQAVYEKYLAGEGR